MDWTTRTAAADVGGIRKFDPPYFDGITVLLAADNLGVQEQRLDRRFFTPNRFPGGAFTAREFMRTDNATPVYTLSVSGSF